MFKIRINNIEVDAEAGETILSVSQRAGVSIPTLCHMDGIEHYTSCMVCMVRDKASDSYLPSCTALVREGMDIDASGEDVVSARKKAVELLLSEHRAECEAPCRIVCPAGYDIPRLNRLLAAGEYIKAIELVMSELDAPEIRCLSCRGYCENACRRRKIDRQVSIRNIRIFIYHNLNYQGGPQKPVELTEFPDFKKIFSSRTGRIEEEELKEWLKECREAGKRFESVTDFISAGEEAKNCMHCDCRASDNCRLRELAQELGIRDRGNKVAGLPLTKKISQGTGLIFEHAKCIKCGLCVRICEDKKEEPSLCFINRGFVSLISEPLTAEFDDIPAAQAELCVNVCPTGALSFF
ncbi:MAG TPA: 2Fe-2S iron-sulfur cluster-binding protein [Bacteroidales bacterium]|jgi:ferredoxin|nr:2Fe-2S iron-sulfur cluster-binding protein [Bacteroidales bacterium]HOS72595.1 2Fe-2S iron-sulfur cluster-binding protein [Bacteroidales bacterium]HQH23346.1 2Fe-2S iron-sulfur cluster-binding protein [Bacteroidales bacterium]HQJ81409.1 2Fe-2S iron-sulfur cluster-binding protein [Bacteroidales bacterium]